MRIGQSASAHDQTQLASLAAHPGDVRRLGDLGHPGVGIGDGAPCRLVDGVDAGPDLGVDVDRDGVGHAQAHQGVDERVGEEPGIGPQGERTAGPGPAHPGNEFFDESLVAALGGSLAQAGVEHLARLGPRGDERVIAEDGGVAIGGALLRLSVDLADRRIEVHRHGRVIGPSP